MNEPYPSETGFAPESSSAIPSNGEFFRAWFMCSILAAFGGFGCGLAIGALLGFVMGLVGTPIETIQIVCGVVGFFLGLVCSFLAYRWSVIKFLLNR